MNEESATPPKKAGNRLQQIEGIARALDDSARRARSAPLGPLSIGLAESMREVLAEGPLVLRVTPFGLAWNDRPLYQSDQRSEHLYALYRDGVRGLTFYPRVSPDELVLFLELFASEPPPGEDRVTLLWGRAPENIRFHAAEVQPSPVTLDDAGDVLLKLQTCADGRPEAISLEEIQSAIGAPAPSVSERAAAFRDAFRRDQDPERFLQIALDAAPEAPPPVLMEAVRARIRQGRARDLASLLQRIADAPGADALRRELTRPPHLSELAAACDAHPEALSGALEALFHPGDPAPVDLLLALESPAARARLQAGAERLGCDLLRYHTVQLQRPDPAAALEAIYALDARGGLDTTGAMAGGLTHPAAEVRRATLGALRGRWDESLRAGVGQALSDADRDSRALALGLIQASGDPRMGRAVLSAVRAPSFSGRDDGERAALLTCLARFDDAPVGEWFTELLKRTNLTRNKAVIADQVAAVAALGAKTGRSGGWRRRLLDEAAGRWYLPRPVKEALRAARA